MWSGDQGLNDPTENTVFAKLVHPENGWPYEQECAKKLTVGKTYLVSRISMGQSSTSVHLQDVEGVFSSVQFDFFDHNLKPLDIYNDPRFNHYLAIFGEVKHAR
jgi:hypothetical protein